MSGGIRKIASAAVIVLSGFISRGRSSCQWVVGGEWHEGEEVMDLTDAGLRAWAQGIVKSWERDKPKGNLALDMLDARLHGAMITLRDAARAEQREAIRAQGDDKS